MYEAMSIAATGLRSQQMRIDVIANNVANVNTVAYKGTRLDFRDALYTYGLVPGEPRSPEENQQKGHGVLPAHVGREFRPGFLERTDRDLDFGIQGEGFFSVSDENGETRYTRKGNFSLSTEEDAIYMVTSEGYYLLDENGDRIGMPFGTNTITVDTDDGMLHFLIGDTELGQARLGIFTFRNIHGLETVGDGNFTPSPAAGERLDADEAIVRQGVLEGSNVSLPEEMTRMIRTQRAFQLASRALTTADEMEGVANSMRR